MKFTPMLYQLTLAQAHKHFVHLKERRVPNSRVTLASQLSELCTSPLG